MVGLTGDGLLMFCLSGRNTFGKQRAFTLVEIMLDSAESQFAIERSKKSGDALVYQQDLTPYIKLNSAGQIPGCPAGGNYLIASVGSRPDVFAGQHGDAAAYLAVTDVRLT